MTTFKLIPQDQLSAQHFEEYPIWSEFYDYEELEEIASWGIDRDWLTEELTAKHSGNKHCVYPLLQTVPFPKRMRIFIKADFITSTGIKLKGYVMNEDAFVIGIFHEGREFVFSRHPGLADLNEEDRIDLQNCISSAQNIFPMAYRTDFNDCDGKPIVGEFDYS